VTVIIIIIIIIIIKYICKALDRSATKAHKNFIEIGSRVRPPDAHNSRKFNAPLLGNGRCHGNQIVGDMSGT